MKKIKEGFTLLELLVAISISTVLFALIGASFVFINSSTTDIIYLSTSTYSIRNIRDYIIKNQIDENNSIEYVERDLYVDNERVFDDLPFDSLSFNFMHISNDNSDRCGIVYKVNDEDKYIEFTVKVGG